MSEFEKILKECREEKRRLQNAVRRGKVSREQIVAAEKEQQSKLICKGTWL